LKPSIWAPNPSTKSQQNTHMHAGQPHS
jgi:hypothetical protein